MKPHFERAGSLAAPVSRSKDVVTVTGCKRGDAGCRTNITSSRELKWRPPSVRIIHPGCRGAHQARAARPAITDAAERCAGSCCSSGITSKFLLSSPLWISAVQASRAHHPASAGFSLETIGAKQTGKGRSRPGTSVEYHSSQIFGQDRKTVDTGGRGVLMHGPSLRQPSKRFRLPGNCRWPAGPV